MSCHNQIVGEEISRKDEGGEVLRHCCFFYLHNVFVNFIDNGNSNFELGTAICYIDVENYFLTIIKHIAVPSSKLEFPLLHRTCK